MKWGSTECLSEDTFFQWCVTAAILWMWVLQGQWSSVSGLTPEWGVERGYVHTQLWHNPTQHHTIVRHRLNCYFLWCLSCKDPSTEFLTLSRVFIVRMSMHKDIWISGFQPWISQVVHHFINEYRKKSTNIHIFFISLLCLNKYIYKIKSNIMKILFLKIIVFC